MLKSNKYKGHITSYLIIAALILFNNFVFPNINKGLEYPADTLKSELCPDQGAKSAESGQSGFLTYGPYIPMSAQRINAEIYYSSSDEGNTYEVYSDQNRIIYYSDYFPAGKSKVAFSADITNDVNDLEVRTFYNGTGEMTINKIVIKTRQKDLMIILCIYDVIYIAALVINTVLLIKAIKGSSDSQTGKGS